MKEGRLEALMVSSHFLFLGWAGLLASLFSDSHQRMGTESKDQVDQALLIGFERPGCVDDDTSKNDVEVLVGALRKNHRLHTIGLNGMDTAPYVIHDCIEQLAEFPGRSQRLFIYVSAFGAFKEGTLEFSAREWDEGPSKYASLRTLVRECADEGFGQIMLIVDGTAAFGEFENAGPIRLDLPKNTHCSWIVASNSRFCDHRLGPSSPFTRVLRETWADPSTSGKSAWTWLPAVMSRLASNAGHCELGGDVRVEMYSSDVRSGFWLDAP